MKEVMQNNTERTRLFSRSLCRPVVDCIPISNRASLSNHLDFVVKSPLKHHAGSGIFNRLMTRQRQEYKDKNLSFIEQPCLKPHAEETLTKKLPEN